MTLPPDSITSCLSNYLAAISSWKSLYQLTGTGLPSDNRKLSFFLRLFTNWIYQHYCIMPVKRPASLMFSSRVTTNDGESSYDDRTQDAKSVLLGIFREHTVLFPTGTWLMLGCPTAHIGADVVHKRALLEGLGAE